MNTFKKLNNRVGWGVFAIAAFVYLSTIEPTASWWDPGEYIATSFKLQVGHPPGAPLFQMMGRFFSLFSFGNVAHVAMMINIMSALASAFTILFLFWTITLFAKRFISENPAIYSPKAKPWLSSVPVLWVLWPTLFPIRFGFLL